MLRLQKQRSIVIDVKTVIASHATLTEKQLQSVQRKFGNTLRGQSQCGHCEIESCSKKAEDEW
jgi:hypothetical protein